MQTTNNIIIEAIDLLVECATGNASYLRTIWKHSHSTIRVEEAIDNIEADEFPTAPENRKLFTAARLALEAVTE